MNQSIANELNEEKNRLSEIVQNLEKVIARAPKGSLHIMVSKGKYPQFYLYEDKAKEKYPHGRFLRKDERNIAKKVAQKEYNVKTIGICNERIKVIDKFLKGIEENNPELVYEKCLPARKELIVPAFISESEFRNQWHEETKGQQNGIPFSKEFITGRNEIVRSKSEAILANLFDKLGIDYVYEPAVYFEYSCFYPDFGLLDLKNRRTIYFEHFGKMDDPDYSSRVMEKMNTYIKNGIMPGRDLLFSMESSENPLDTRVVEKMLKSFFF